MFSSKVSSPNKDKVIKIAEKNNAILDKSGLYKVPFESITPDFLKLLSLCSGWSSTELYIDDNEVNIRELDSVLICYNKESCNGICDKIKFNEFYSLSNMIDTIRRVDSGDYWDPERLKIQLEGSDIFLKIKNNSYKVDKVKLKEKIQKQLEYPIKFCDKIKTELTLKQLDNLPDKFTIKPRKESSFSSNSSVIVNDNVEFEGFRDYELSKITARAEIEAQIFAKALSEELKKYFKK